MKTTGIKCNKCRVTIFSRARHDFRYCKCGGCAIDGGQDYFRIIGEGYEVVDLDLDVERKDLFNDYNYGLDNYGMIEE